jgi:hypothetical protein
MVLIERGVLLFQVTDHLLLVVSLILECSRVKLAKVDGGELSYFLTVHFIDAVNLSVDSV